MAKCPRCGAWSLTYDYRNNAWTCHVYGALMLDESIRK